MSDEMIIIPVVDEGLGNSAYLVNLGDGRALAIDASRDLRSLDAVAAARGLRIVAAADTHLHADFLSGATRLAARDGAQVYASAAGHRDFAHVALADEDAVDLGGLTLRAWATPGHTGEHLSYLLLDGMTTLAVFTGGSLLVGAAARTDLVSPDQTEQLARAQYASIQRLLTLPDDTGVFPTHGAGSFCSAPPGSERTTTIGRERATNPLLQVPDQNAFVAQLLDSIGSFPPYFLRLGELNRRGPVLPAEHATLPALSVGEVLMLQASGAEVIDVRPTADYAAGHVPNSIANPLRGAFATWLGWTVTDLATPLVFVRNADQDPEEIVWQARKIGYDNLVGDLDFTAWVAAGQHVTTTPLVTPAELGTSTVIDVRQANEYASGHVPQARNLELGVLTVASIDEEPLVTMCGHGERAATGASLLERGGHEHLAIFDGGPADWAAATGGNVEVSA